MQLCKIPVKVSFLETLQLRLRNDFKEISDKPSTKKWFPSQLFLASFVRRSEAGIRRVLLKICS